MNKKNKILVGCLALLLALSVGYALFSETITINGTATAKGSFKLTTTCQPGWTQDVLDALLIADGGTAGTVTDGNIGQVGFENDTCVVSGNKVTMGVSLLYPSASRYFTINIENTGTIDAVLPTSIPNKYDVEQTLEIYNLSDDSLVSTHQSGTNNFWSTAINYSHFVEFGDGGLFIGKNLEGNLSWEEEEFNSNSMMLKDSSGNSYLRLKPGEKLIVSIPAEWDSRSTDKTKYSKVTATLEFPFSQLTSDMIETTDGVVDIY